MSKLPIFTYETRLSLMPEEVLLLDGAYWALSGRAGAEFFCARSGLCVSLNEGN
ncbi:hypothetical protein [Candidatus Methylacidithermus pantelleriae]|uniref:hypothetical protein n=1 Tax=Candidatus Methylacidithermus pantelleriae TaxID=2744239 RepID=UPI00157D192D|nr:hypothetical protein [Candidatus Methylacidithermus pantelleriae]